MTSNEFNTICIETLRSSKLAERVAVIGSGPSSPYIAPNEQLKKILCSSCGVRQKSEEEFWVLAERAYDKKPDKYAQAIKDTFEDTPHWQSRTYTYIADLNVVGFVTLNYDDQLPHACRIQMKSAFEKGFTVHPGRDGQTHAMPSDFSGPNKQVIALHGYCDPNDPHWENNVILRTSDYNKYYINNPCVLFHWWKIMLTTMPCLFLGTSLKEPGLYRVIEHLLKNDRDRLLSNKHLHLKSCTFDDKLKKYPNPGKSLSVIDQVLYDQVDSKHSGLIEILGSLTGLPTDRPSPRSPGPDLIRATDTFDYYSS